MADIKWKRASYEVDEWFVESDHFRTAEVIQLQSDPYYAFGISAYNNLNPHIYSLSISVLMDTKTEYEVYSFKSKTTSIYEIPIANDQVPTVEFIFLFVGKAGYDYAVEFENRKAQTLNQHRNIPVPLIADLRQGIQGYIDYWDKNVRYTALN